MLPERAQMKSTIGSHGHVKMCRGVHAVDYELLAGKSGTNVLQKHPHHPNGQPKGSYGAQDGGVLVGVSIEADNQHEYLSLRVVSYEPGCDGPCGYARTKY
jgi:hypothetical protein